MISKLLLNMFPLMLAESSQLETFTIFHRHHNPQCAVQHIGLDGPCPAFITVAKISATSIYLARWINQDALFGAH